MEKVAFLLTCSTGASKAMGQRVAGVLNPSPMRPTD
jgi:hypothetical protein